MSCADFNNYSVTTCPYCDNDKCYADFCDVGVGMVQCGPFHCTDCGASEIGPYDDPRPLSEDENRTGWYGPDSEPGSNANVIGGKIVSHTEMKTAYHNEFYANPDYEVEGFVDEWFKEIRTKK